MRCEMNFIEAIRKLNLDRTNKLMRKAEWFIVGGANYNELSLKVWCLMKYLIQLKLNSDV